MLEDIVLPSEWQIRFKGYKFERDFIEITAGIISSQATCHSCGRRSFRVHSRYIREPTDLPLVGYPVRLFLELRRFFCDNPMCGKRTFTEQIPELVGFRQRRTERLLDLFLIEAFVLGGEAGARTLQKMGIKVSPDTLLRIIKRTPLPEFDTPRILGVDDWAFRKGRNYGTIMVNLETHRVVDLLPDREAQTIADWLKDHPGVEVISRDRGGAYADGARRGSPEALQVADRFHLLKNLVDYLKTIFERKRASLRESPPRQSTEVVAEPVETPELLTLPIQQPEPECSGSIPEEEVVIIESEQHAVSLVSNRKTEVFEQIKQLQGQGYSKRETARTLEISRGTVKKYLDAGQVPRYAQRERRSILDPYKPYLEQRREEGCFKRKILFEEIRERGYRGSWALLGLYLSDLNFTHPPPVVPLVPKDLRGKSKRIRPPPPPRQIVSARHAAFLMIKPEEELDERERKHVDQLRNFDSELGLVYNLSQEFAKMLRQREVGRLGPWLIQVEESEISELKSFGFGLKQDRAAVEAGLSVEYSQGQVEGHVNRLKTIKRSMYGRAGFELLRARVLYAA